MSVKKKRKPRASILDYHQEKIKELITKGVSYNSAYKLINYELPTEITYPTFLNYCKNRLGL